MEQVSRRTELRTAAPPDGPLPVGRAGAHKTGLQTGQPPAETHQAEVAAKEPGCSTLSPTLPLGIEQAM